MSSAKFFKTAFSVTAVLGVLVAGGYVFYDRNQTAIAQESEDTPAAAPAAPPAMPVQTVTVAREAVRQWNDFSGRLRAVDQVDLRPQVGGTIVEIRFEDGQMVAKGDVLAVIDPRSYQADVTRLKAEVEAARDNLALAEKEKVRAEQLVANGTVPKRTLDERTNTFLVAKAAVNSATAGLKQAQILLDHAYVKAPITGRVSRVEITEGNYVAAGASAPVLTTIVSTDNIYADFEVDEQTYLQHMHGIHGSDGSKPEVPVELALTNGMTITGFVYSVDNRIDPATGTIRTRALFSNDAGMLLPGMFAQLRLGTALKSELILLPPRAIGTDQNRKFVLAVSAENTAEYRVVTLGATVDGRRVVTSGLETGDRVIVEGLMKIRPGMPVSPQEAEPLS